MLKYFVLVLVAAFVIGAQAVGDEQKEKLKGYVKDCIAETKVDPELVKRVRSSGVVENDAKYKEYLFCFNKKVGFQNAAGEFQKAAIKAQILASWNDVAEVDKLIAKCLVHKATPQESAYEGMKCIRTNSPKDKKVLELIKD